MPQSRSAQGRDAGLAAWQKRFMEMLETSGVLSSPRLAAAFREVPRHLFVDRYYERVKGRLRVAHVAPAHPTPKQLRRIYRDDVLMTAATRDSESTNSQPSLVAQMVRDLQLDSGMSVLEIGAGTGRNAALMGHVVGPTGRVCSIDLNADVCRRARTNVRRLGISNVTVVTADGSKGFPRAGPFDRLVTTVASPHVFREWLVQLGTGGLALLLLQDLPPTNACLLMRLVRREDRLEGDVIGLPWFMPLRGRNGLRRTERTEAARRLETRRAGRRPHKQLAPWAAWHPRAFSGRGRDLLFFAHLEGMSVEPVESEFVISLDDSEDFCIAGSEYVETFGDGHSLRMFESVVDKWKRQGLPPRHGYRVEVWGPDVELDRPADGWLVRDAHSQLVFRRK